MILQNAMHCSQKNRYHVCNITDTKYRIFLERVSNSFDFLLTRSKADYFHHDEQGFQSSERIASIYEYPNGMEEVLVGFDVPIA